MSIQVRYFASLKEKLAKSEELATISGNTTVADIWEQLNPNLAMPTNTLAAINMEYVELKASVIDGDEVAFFPPVTGG